MRRSGKASYQAGRLLAMLGAAGVAIVTGGCGGSTAPAAPTLAENSTTVQAALNSYITGVVNLPPTCSASIAINCPGGTAGSTTEVDLNRSGPTITRVAPDSFAYAMDVGINTQAPFTISTNGIDCGVAANTFPGSSQVVHVAGTAKFTSRTVGGPIDELDLTSSMSGAEAADLTITGGAACQIVSSLFESVMLSAITQGTTRLCAGSGGQLTSCS